KKPATLRGFFRSQGESYEELPATNPPRAVKAIISRLFRRKVKDIVITFSVNSVARNAERIRGDVLLILNIKWSVNHAFSPEIPGEGEKKGRKQIN
ncbi:hypothetical protein, partial [Klebsiella variicola]|uniref:hypothetical protein n=1 Tax=Klebsiella variicola TaxID=244366 RepID=UPI002B054DB6